MPQHLDTYVYTSLRNLYTYLWGISLIYFHVWYILIHQIHALGYFTCFLKAMFRYLKFDFLVSNKWLFFVPMFLHLTKHWGYLDWWVHLPGGFHLCLANLWLLWLVTWGVSLSHIGCSLTLWIKCILYIEKLQLFPPKLAAAFCRGTKKDSKCLGRASSQASKGVLFLDGPYM